MAILLFKLTYVPDDEAQDIRALLDENGIDFYETSAGIFGFSMPGLWLENIEQEEKARRLIEEYQQSRQEKVREEYRLTHRSFLDLFKENPLRYIGIILAIVLICYFMIFSFFAL